MIMTQGALFNSYAEGAQSDFMRSGYPAFVSADSLQRWVDITLTPRQRDTLKAKYGPVPGEYLTYVQDGKPGIAVSSSETWPYSHSLHRARGLTISRWCTDLCLCPPIHSSPRICGCATPLVLM